MHMLKSPASTAKAQHWQLFICSTWRILCRPNFARDVTIILAMRMPQLHIRITCSPCCNALCNTANMVSPICSRLETFLNAASVGPCEPSGILCMIHLGPMSTSRSYVNILLASGTRQARQHTWLKALLISETSILYKCLHNI